MESTDVRCRKQMTNFMALKDKIIYTDKLIERYQAKAKECVFLHCQLQEASERALAVETNAKGLRMELNALHLENGDLKKEVYSVRNELSSVMEKCTANEVIIGQLEAKLFETRANDLDAFMKETELKEKKLRKHKNKSKHTNCEDVEDPMTDTIDDDEDVDLLEAMLSSDADCEDDPALVCEPSQNCFGPSAMKSSSLLLPKQSLILTLSTKDPLISNRTDPLSNACPTSRIPPAEPVASLVPVEHKPPISSGSPIANKHKRTPSEALPSSPTEPIGCPTEALPSIGCPTEPLPSIGSPTEPVPSSGSPSESLPTTGSPTETLPSPIEPLPSTGSPTEPFPSSGSSTEPLPLSQSPTERLSSSGSSTEPLSSGRSPTEPLLSSGSPTELLSSSQSPTEPLSSSWSPTEPLSSSWSPTEPLPSSPSPTECLPSSGSPTEPLSLSRSPTEPLSSSQSPTEPLSSSWSPTEPLSSSGSPTEPLPSSQSPTERLPSSGSPTEPLLSSWSPAEPLSSSGPPTEPLSTSGSPTESLSSSGSPTEPLPSSQSPTERLPSSGSPTETLSTSGSATESLSSSGSPLPSSQSSTECLPSSGSPTEPLSPSWSPTEPLPSSQSPTEHLPSSGSPTEHLSSSRSPTEPLPSSVSSTESVSSSRSPTEHLPSSESPTEPLLSNAEPLPSTGSPSEPLPSSESPTEPLLSSGSPTEPLLSTGSPTEPLLSSGSPTEPLPYSASTTELHPSSRSPTEPSWSVTEGPPCSESPLPPLQSELSPINGPSLATDPHAVPSLSKCTSLTRSQPSSTTTSLSTSSFLTAGSDCTTDGQIVLASTDPVSVSASDSLPTCMWATSTLDKTCTVIQESFVDYVVSSDDESQLVIHLSPASSECPSDFELEEDDCLMSFLSPLPPSPCLRLHTISPLFPSPPPSPLVRQVISPLPPSPPPPYSPSSQETLSPLPFSPSTFAAYSPLSPLPPSPLRPSPPLPFSPTPPLTPCSAVEDLVDTRVPMEPFAENGDLHFGPHMINSNSPLTDHQVDVQVGVVRNRDSACVKQIGSKRHFSEEEKSSSGVYPLWKRLCKRNNSPEATLKLPTCKSGVTPKMSEPNATFNSKPPNNKPEATSPKLEPISTAETSLQQCLTAGMRPGGGDVSLAQRQLPEALQCPLPLPAWLVSALDDVKDQPYPQVTSNLKESGFSPLIPVPKGENQKLLDYVAANTVMLMCGLLHLTTVVRMFSSEKNVSDPVQLALGTLKCIMEQYSPEIDLVVSLFRHRCDTVQHHKQVVNPLDFSFPAFLLKPECLLLSLFANISQSNDSLGVRAIAELIRTLYEAMMKPWVYYHKLYAMCRLFTALCRLQGDVVQVQYFMWDLLQKPLKPAEYHILPGIVCVWPRVLARKQDVALLCKGTVLSHGLEQQMLSCTLEFIITALLKTQTEPVYSIMWRHMCLLCKWKQEFLHFQEKHPLNSLTKALMDILTTNSNITIEPHSLRQFPWRRPQPSVMAFQAIHCLRMLSVHNGWVWTNDCLIRTFLWPVLQQWNKNSGSIKEAVVVCIVRLIGVVSRQGVMDNPKSNSVMRLQRMLTSLLERSENTKEMTLPIQLAAADSLQELYPPKAKELVRTMKSWLTHFRGHAAAAALVREYKEKIS